MTNEALILAPSGVGHGRRLLRGTVPRRESQRLAILERNFVGILSVFPRQMFDEASGFDSTMRQLEDWQFWLRAIFSGWRVVVQPEPAALYRFTANSLSTLPDRFDQEMKMLASLRDSGSLDLSPEETRYLMDRLSSPPPMQLRQIGADALRRRDWSAARDTYRQLARLTRNNGKVRARAQLIAHLPGAARAFGWRQRTIDDRLLGGARTGDDTHRLEGWRT